MPDGFTDVAAVGFGVAPKPKDGCDGVMASEVADGKEGNVVLTTDELLVPNGCTEEVFAAKGADTEGAALLDPKENGAFTEELDWAVVVVAGVCPNVNWDEAFPVSILDVAAAPKGASGGAITEDEVEARPLSGVGSNSRRFFFFEASSRSSRPLESPNDEDEATELNWNG